MNKESDILFLALNKLKEHTKLPIEVKSGDTEVDGCFIDTVIIIGKLTFYIEIEKWAAQANRGVLIKKMKEIPGNRLLVADYINENMSEKLCQENIQFLDSVGNAYINSPPLYIQIKGQRKSKIIKKRPTGLAFGTAGLKVVFTLLNNSVAINYTYRVLAAKAGVALGTVAKVFDELKSMKFIVSQKETNQRLLINKHKLFDLWVENYPFKLKNKLFMGNYVNDDMSWWDRYPIEKHRANWGGEVAAAIETKQLQPEQVIIYLPNEEKLKLMQNAKLKKKNQWLIHDQNIVSLYEKFWSDEENVTITPALITYADLLASADARNREVANIIYQKNIKERLVDD